MNAREFLEILHVAERLKDTLEKIEMEKPDSSKS